MKKCLQQPTYSCAIAPHSGNGISGHRTTKILLYFYTWSSFPTHLLYLPWFGGIIFSSNSHNLCTTAGFATDRSGYTSFFITLFVYQELFYKTCGVLVVIYASGLGILCSASLASCPLDLMGRIWFPKLGFHSCGLTGFLSARTKEVSAEQQLNTHFKLQTSQLEQLLRFEVVLLTSLANW